jgi:hypothetical protein
MTKYDFLTDPTASTCISKETVAPIFDTMPPRTVEMTLSEPVSRFDREEMTLWIRGNKALGAYLAVGVAAILGHLPVNLQHSTALVEPLAALAAGLPLPQDDWYDTYTFTGHREILALACVFEEGGFDIEATDRTVRLLPN